MKLKMVLLILFSSITCFAGINLKHRAVNLNGLWKFEIGDDMLYAGIDFDDSNWEEIYVPSSWEDEGFPGYDGYAWYRIHFTIDSEFKDELLYLHFGPIDDADETYLNGQLVGYKGGFPPDYWTYAHNDRLYPLPASTLNFDGDNVLAVRVYDQSGTGGIVRGKNGIYAAEMEIKPEITITGTWKFKPGDNKKWKDINFDDSDWDDVLVPSYWGLYGYKDYDGFAWYRKKVFLDYEFEDEKLILLVGKIDDMDETFLNGHRIGGTGRIHDDPYRIVIEHSDHLALRAYYIPKNILKFGGENTIAVRVYDGTTYGGIYQGPFGFVTRERYLKYKRSKRNNFLDILEKIFD